MRLSSAFSIALFASLLAAGAARADGSSYFNPNVGTGVADFSGFDIGLDGGLGLGSVRGADASGYVAGGHIGYNLQNGPLVGGFSFNGLFENPSVTNGDKSITYNTLGSFRGRGGYAFGNFLAYGTLGWAVAGTQYSDSKGSDNEAMTGFVLGLGGEYAITRNITARVEYNHYSLDSVTYDNHSGGYKSGNATQDLLTVGVAAHF